VGAVQPPALKRMKTSSDSMAEEPHRPPLSTGLSVLLREANLSYEDKGQASDDKVTLAGQSKAGWTEAEDKLVLLAVRTFGTQWTAVSAQLVGRTADAVRNRWHRLQKRGLAEASEEVAAPRQLLGMGGSRATSSDQLPPFLNPGSPSSSASASWSASGRLSSSIASSIHHSSDGAGTIADEELSRTLAPAQGALQQGALGTSLNLAALPNGGDVMCLTGSDHGRARWTAHEDQVIQSGVARWGCKWRQIAAMLPGRSDSSIR